jgi:hypothetical protein
MANKVETIIVVLRKLSVCPWTRDLTIDKSIITHTIENPALAAERPILEEMSASLLSFGFPEVLARDSR